MRIDNEIIIILGILTIAWPFIAFGLLIDIGDFGFLSWFIGPILVAIGLDRNKKERLCPHCGWDRFKDEKICPHCGFRFINRILSEKEAKNKKVILIIVTVVIVVIVLFLFLTRMIAFLTY